MVGVADGDAEDDAVGLALADVVGLALGDAVDDGLGDGCATSVALPVVSAEMLPWAARVPELPTSMHVSVNVPGAVTGANSVALAVPGLFSGVSQDGESIVTAGAIALPSRLSAHVDCASDGVPLLVTVTVACTNAGAFGSASVTTVVASAPKVSTLPLPTYAAPCPAGPAGPRGPVAPCSCFTTDGEICDRLVMT